MLGLFFYTNKFGKKYIKAGFNHLYIYLQIKQESLRQQIGVVPQDTVLFNDEIRYNIRYSKFNATDEEIEGAADVADIHHRILSFPKSKQEAVVIVGFSTTYAISGYRH